MKKILVLMIILLLAFTLIGCKEGAKEPASRPSAASSGSTDSGSSDSGSSESSVEVESEDGGFADKFTNFVTKKIGLKYTVEYKMTSSDPDSQAFTMKQYFGGAGKMRMDMSMEEGDARTYILDDTFTTCNNMQGDWMCMKISGMESQQSDNTAQFRSVEDNPGLYNIDYAGTMKVAGTTAQCYTIGMDRGKSGDLKYCFSKEGVPLYMKITAEGTTTEMKAITYKTSVKSSDFDVPAEAQDMSALMEQYRSQMPEGVEMPDY